MVPKSAGARLLSWWRRLSPLPGGRWLFSRFVGQLAPYSGSMGGRVVALEPGHARIILRDRRQVRNHLGSVHAIALANLGELASGLALTTALPPDVRGIPVALSVTYLKKARGTLVAETSATAPPVADAVDHTVAADIRDEDGDVVARVSVTWRLSPVPAPLPEDEWP